MSKSLWLLCGISTLLLGSCLAQDAGQPPSAPEKVPETQKLQNALTQMKNLPAEWLIGPYIPSSGPLIPLTDRKSVV